jgi:hypothetical protein
MTSRLTRLVGKDKMLKKIFRKTLVIFLCHALAYAPLVNAAQLSLPSGDLIAPVVAQDKYENTVRPGTDHEVEVKVTDNVDVKLVTMFYRTIGKGEYERLTMQKVGTSDFYVVKINADEIKSPGIEYYIQAMDFAGNTVLHGHSFSPLSVKMSNGDAAVAASSTSTSLEAEESSSIWSNKWLWIGLGVVAVGLAASGGGDSGGEPTSTTGTVTITGTTP